MFHVAEEHVISGIFIKHVLEDSPAGRNGTLKTGDRILQVSSSLQPPERNQCVRCWYSEVPLYYTSKYRFGYDMVMLWLPNVLPWNFTNVLLATACSFT